MFSMEDYLVETEKYRGHKIKIYQDIDPPNPREWEENLGKMVCFHRRYDLGDKHDFSDARDLISFVESKDIVSLPLFLIDHSGLAMNTGGFRHCDPQGWDWGQVGFIYADKDALRNEYGVKHVTKKVREKALAVLQSEVEQYDKFLRGWIYGYLIEDADGEQLDSCWGYFDDPADIIKECKAIIDRHIQAENEKKHYPKVEVFVTKTHKFRARIRESIEEPSYEVSIGGEEWSKGKGKNHKAKILEKMDEIGKALGQEFARAIHEK